MGLQFYNSLTRKVEPFRPPGAPVGLYTCGPTVYNYLHVGNYRTYVFEDVLRRTLERLGYQVKHVMNITDVGHLTSQADEGEDKMEVGAAREGKTAWDVAKFYTESFLEDSKKLNLLPPEVLCRATDNIPEQIALIERLEGKGLTYRTSDGIYYDTARFPDYARLAGGAHLEGIQEGARVAANREKRGPTDFALWKFSPRDQKRQMEWDSPWGRGFPGWHIECSAMAMKYLGETFDIHCGGVDHIPIHHTNEIAQAEGATGKPFVRVWMHGEFLVVNKAKMAKSAGGFIRLKDLEDKGFDALDYRYFCFGAHYRRQLEFSWEALEAARTARRRLRERVAAWKTADNEPPISRLTVGDVPTGIKSDVTPGKGSKKVEDWLKAFDACLADDLDMPGAIASMYAALEDLADPRDRLTFLGHAEKVLALGLFEAKADSLPPELQALFDRYAAAKKTKDYDSSDALRKELAAKGVQVSDTPKGPVWRRA